MGNEITVVSENSIRFSVKQMLRHFKVRHTKHYVNKTLKDHPDYPSLLALCDTLKEYNIENAAIKIAREELLQMPVPFIAHIQKKESEFVFVKEITDSRVFFETQNGNDSIE